MTANKLPAKLDMHQARAWVLWRDAGMILKAIERCQLPGPCMTDQRKQYGSEQKLADALLNSESGLIAYGTLGGGVPMPIPHYEWGSLPIAPRDHSRLHPYSEIFVLRDDLLQKFRPREEGKVPANRKMNHDEIRRCASVLRDEQPGISIGSAALSIARELPTNPKTKKHRDSRGIERIIADLWGGESSTVP